MTARRVAGIAGSVVLLVGLGWLAPAGRIVVLDPVVDGTVDKAFNEIARRHHVMSIIDSTFATPFNQRPLEFGSDLVTHSATKYLAGHNDIRAGCVLGKKEIIDKIRKVEALYAGSSSAGVNTGLRRPFRSAETANPCNTDSGPRSGTAPPGPRAAYSPAGIRSASTRRRGTSPAPGG